MAQAAWWNPFSWVNKAPVAAPSTTTTIDVSVSGPALANPMHTKTETVYKDRVIEKTSVVQDPALLTQINDLKASVAALTAQKNDLQSQLNLCKQPVVPSTPVLSV